MTPATRRLNQPENTPAPPARVEQAKPSDAGQIANLLRHRAPKTIPVPRAEVRADIERYRVVRDHGTVVATAALTPVTDQLVELRSVAVANGSRGCGLGRRIVEAAKSEVQRQGRLIACVTTTPEFFERLGFERVPMSLVPPKPDRPPIPTDRPRVAMVW